MNIFEYTSQALLVFLTGQSLVSAVMDYGASFTKKRDQWMLASMNVMFPRMDLPCIQYMHMLGVLLERRPLSGQVERCSLHKSWAGIQLRKDWHISSSVE